MRRHVISFVLLGFSAACGRAGAQSVGISPPATFTTLVNLHKSAAENPYLETLVQGKDGNLYGTTVSGGANGVGTVFKVTLSGKLTVLHSFAGTEGKTPESGLLLGADGNLYGMADSGGNNYGTVFKITRTGVFTTLHVFNNLDGSAPVGALIRGTDGKLYGTTSQGGGTGSNGTVFKMTPAGILKTLHQFNNTDGNLPSDTLVQGSDGNFYGTTVAGGTNFFSGTVFKITPAGSLTTLYNFCAQSNCTDGAIPMAGLVQGSDGSFYGTTEQGGANDDGTVFKITSSGALTTLYSFCSLSNCTDGELPEAGLIQGTDGNFYGTTTGFAKNYGTIFQITPSGTLTTLYNFSSTDGSYPYGGLVQHTNGTFYGVTNQGGTGGVGTIFSLNMGLGPFVNLLPAFGKVGATVTILGTNLTGVTSVSFNGTSATFKVPTSTYLTATVPAGATSGLVQVVTSAGALQSNVAFQVVP